MRTLLLDNYDSFTFNLYQLLAEVNRIAPLVVRNDAAAWEVIRRLDFDNIVISPGPGRPDVPADFGICHDAILETDVPVLGVCLGHQGLCQAFGGELGYASHPMHGRPSQIRHTGADLFAGIPSPFTAIRYHSLLVTSLPETLEAIAWSEDDVLMGVRHRSRPIWGVQFHPESIRTAYGHELLQNFQALTAAHLRRNAARRRAFGSTGQHGLVDELSALPVASLADSMAVTPRIHGGALRVHHRRVPLQVEGEAVFLNLFAAAQPAFWLDSALSQKAARFSFMGDAGGPHAEFVSYDAGQGRVSVRQGDRTAIHDESLFDYLDRMLRERHLSTDDLPFDFNCGYVGYFGYEMKAECGADAAHRASTADAAFIFADRLVVLDHESGVVYLVCVDDAAHTARAIAWLDDIEARLGKLAPAPPLRRTRTAQPLPHTLRHPEPRYLELIGECQRQIRQGESYEVCLTNMIESPVRVDPLETYRVLRLMNPAPYSAFLRFPDVAVLSASPERFLTIGRSGTVTSTPIKGTRRRGATPQEDAALLEDLRTNAKDRSENLMIVDLVRNDLGAVCNTGSVRVPALFTVESYATVHQLVSSIEGQLRPGISALQAVRAAFPAGSMTGAPKKRTLEIIDRLEGGPRGVYSGSIGFLGLNGSADLNVAIRTIVVSGAGVSVGCGGAIVDLSDPPEEVEEMLLKARASLQALAETALTPDRALTA